jgi:hypothetical protein
VVLTREVEKCHFSYVTQFSPTQAHGGGHFEIRIKAPSPFFKKEHQLNKAEQSVLDEWFYSPKIQDVEPPQVGLQINFALGSSDFDIFLEIQYASCVFGLALKS